MRAWLAALVTAIGLLLGALPATQAAAAPAPCGDLAAGTSNGLTLQNWSVVPNYDGRLCEAELTTGALFTPRGPGAPQIDPVQKPVRVRVYLPSGYTPSADYPVLFLLHGGATDYLQWSTSGDIKKTVADAGFKGIVVMPEGGKSGFYNDWRGHTYGNFAPLWETFHIKQLVPWVDANFGTSGTKSGRAIAGVSMGGYGALKYAAQYGTLFSAVGDLSGGTDIRRADHQQIINDGTTSYGARFYKLGTEGDAGNYWKYLLPDNPGPAERTAAIFGPPGPASANWESFNPVQVAEKHPAKYAAYSGKVALYGGGANPDGTQGSSGETDVYQWTKNLHTAMQKTNIPHRYCTGPGAHDFNTFTPELKNFLSFAYNLPGPTCPPGWITP
ncbi:alpha/beta hydrolase [Streptomyces boninensis]|uniref:alpha/beta hydrolase n=1 Tax=Streptomyces boninensis TaxID=2039455 RepID=UPI003B20EE34